jgi:hypothetical protein
MFIIIDSSTPAWTRNLNEDSNVFFFFLIKKEYSAKYQDWRKLQQILGDIRVYYFLRNFTSGVFLV